MMRILFVLAVLFITSAYASETHAQCLSGSSVSQPVVFKTTGNPQLDVAIGQEAVVLASTFNVSPDLYTLMDAASANAFANCQANTVMLGLRLLREELWSMELGPMAVAGIMAHEFSHIYQCDANTTLQGKYRELQADFLAGWYLQKTKARAGFDVSGFARSVWKKGDYNFRDPLHHGTPDERVRAMTAGYNAGAATAAVAYQKSLTYLRPDLVDTTIDTDSEPDEPKMCTRKVPCTHLEECTHPVPCEHPVQCQHTGPCQHTMACQHCMMTPYGMQCQHQYDVQHPYDQMHQADSAHAADPMHPRGDVMHSYDEVQERCE